jgi:O-methyltransferase
MMLDQFTVYTKMHGVRLDHWVETLMRLPRSLPGDIVECGVWRGGAMMIARALCPSRICWLYDTFDGMTAPNTMDRKISTGHPATISYDQKTREGRRWAKATVDDVVDNFLQVGLYDIELLRFVIGPVEQTLLLDRMPSQIAVLRLDTDWYASTRIELEKLYPRLVPGGTLIIDDFGHWAGCRQAVLEYFGPSVVDRLVKIDYSAAALIK